MIVSENSVEKILKAFECHNVRSMSGCKCEQCPYINEKSCVEAFYNDAYRFAKNYAPRKALKCKDCIHYEDTILYCNKLDKWDVNEYWCCAYWEALCTKRKEEKGYLTKPAKVASGDTNAINRKHRG